MFTASFGGKKYNEEDLKFLEYQAALESLKFLKNGRKGDNPFTEEELAETEAKFKKYLSESNGKFISTEVNIRASGLTSKEFMEYFNMKKDPSLWVNSHPNHFPYLDPLVGEGEGRKVGICELMGGMPAKFTLVYSSKLLELVPTPPGYTEYMVAMGYFRDGSPAGINILHTFRDTEDGFEGTTRMFFPASMPNADFVFTENQKHMAVEFMNFHKNAMILLGKKAS